MDNPIAYVVWVHCVASKALILLSGPRYCVRLQRVEGFVFAGPMMRASLIGPEVGAEHYADLMALG